MKSVKCNEDISLLRSHSDLANKLHPTFAVVHFHHNMIIYGTFVIKHCKFFCLNEHFLFLFH